MQRVHSLAKIISMIRAVSGYREDTGSSDDCMKDDSERISSCTSHTDSSISSAGTVDHDAEANDEKGHDAAEATDDENEHDACTCKSRVIM